jgi:uncharacterized membrane protein
VTNLFLFFHLLGAFCFFAGGAVVGVLQLAAIRQERPSQVYAFLRLAPVGAALVGTGALLTLGFGIALAEHEGLGFSPAWIQAALALWVAAMALGAYGGRTARHARHLAEKLASEGDAPSPELRAMVAARGPLWASYASFALLLAIVVLMVWQPGSPSSAAVPAAVEQQIAAGYPRVAYIPARLPGGYSYVNYTQDTSGYTLAFAKNGNDATELDLTIELGCSGGMKPIDAQTRLTMDGQVLLDHFGEDGRTVWECRNGVLRQAYTHDYDTPPTDLGTFVAYAEPIR